MGKSFVTYKVWVFQIIFTLLSGRSPAKSGGINSVRLARNAFSVRRWRFWRQGRQYFKEESRRVLTPKIVKQK